MAENNDRIRQAADALGALEQTDQPPPPDLPPQAPPSDFYSQLTQQLQQRPEGSAPVARVRVVRRPARSLSASLRATIQKAKLAWRKQFGSASPPAPPPVLTPLEKVQRGRQVASRRTAIPPLLTMGLAMVIMGLWSIGVLTMDVDFLHPGQEITVSTTHLAKLTLLAWPIAVILLTGAGLFIYEVHAWFAMYPPQSGTDHPTPRG